MDNSYRRTPVRCAVLALGALLAACSGGDNDSGSAAPQGARTAATTVSSGSTAAAAATSTAATPARIMEHLGRGVVAVRTGANNVFVSWRLLGLEPENIAFNVYRAANDGAPVKLNAAPLTQGTNFTDTAAPRASAYTYTVKAVVDGVEQEASGPFTLKANGAYEPIVRIPLAPVPGEGYYTKWVWVGDLDGDGEYDFVLDRVAPFVPGSNDDLGTGNQYLEAYKRDGTRLWQIDLGPGSRNTYNISPGPTTLSMGMWDGANVYDLNGDGKAEVILQVAAGVKFPDGTTFEDPDPNRQFIAVLDGQTGKPLATRPYPTNFYAQAGRLATMTGIGYPDGVHPSIYFWGRNRNKDKSFNDIFASWSWNGGSTITENWLLPMAANDSQGRSASHQLNILDVDGDGKDEMATGNFVVNSDGTMRYKLPGVVHGDRVYIGKFAKDHAGMRGYGIQQDNPSGLLEYYYDATNGTILWEHSTTPGNIVDVGRGLVADIDPRFPGFEAWSFSGLYNGESGNLAEPNTTLAPWPANMLWWDGDLGSELLNDFKLEKWNHLDPRRSNSLPRLVSLTSSAYGNARLNYVYPMFMGDIMGDWRTEVVLLNNNFTELVIFTTNQATEHRLYTMAHNPAYRNHMTLKGYLQSPLPDYYLGFDMDKPPRPNIRYAGSGAIEAESAQLGGGTTVKSDRAGYIGNGFLVFPATGGSAQWSGIDGGNGGSRTIAIRYANGNPTPRTGVLKVNGVPQPVSFRVTGGWGNWTMLNVTVNLAAGRGNTLRLESTGQGLGYIDQVTVP